MPRFYSELQHASLENLSSDPTAGVAGRVIRNTTDGKVKVDNATNYRAFIVNDDKAVIGNNGTANNNIRLHRGASSVLQFVQGGDVTAEGTLSTALAQISAKFESYLDASKPSPGNAGRVIFITDLLTLLVDNGSAWIPLGSGGGGSSILWYEDENAPSLATINRMQVYSFGQGQGQTIYTEYKVPTSYAIGRPITLKVNHYSADTSGTFLLQTVTTLIRNATDIVSSTTNQRTSTNSAITASGANQNEIQTAICDLTSSTGTINSVAVSPGDTLLIALTRDVGDTAVGQVGFLHKQCEVITS